MPDMPQPTLQPSAAAGDRINGGAGYAATYGSPAYWAEQRRQGKPTPSWYIPPSADWPSGHVIATPEYYADQEKIRATGQGFQQGPSGTAGPSALSQQTGLVAPVVVGDDLRKSLLAQQGGLAGQFADQAQQGYADYGKQGMSALANLQNQASGASSVSAMQLQQGLQQNLAAQRSLAASAPAQNQAMAARTAAIQSSRLGSGLAGQQSVAGLQERNQAQQAYGSLLSGLRGQDLNAATTSRQNAGNAYGAGQTGAPTPSWWDKHGDEVKAGGAALASAFSDRRLKTDVRDGDVAAAQVASALPAAVFRFKDQRFGGGDQLGVMAQDLQGVGLGQAVVDTPHGKVVNGAKLATANTAMIGALARKLDQVAQQVPPPQSARSVFAQSPYASDPYALQPALTPEAVRRMQALAAQRRAMFARDVTWRDAGRVAPTGPSDFRSAADRWTPSGDGSGATSDSGGQ